MAARKASCSHNVKLTVAVSAHTCELCMVLFLSQYRCLMECGVINQQIIDQDQIYTLNNETAERIPKTNTEAIKHIKMERETWEINSWQKNEVFSSNAENNFFSSRHASNTANKNQSLDLMEMHCRFITVQLKNKDWNTYFAGKTMLMLIRRQISQTPGHSNIPQVVHRFTRGTMFFTRDIKGGH
ncbi:hypothetical protein GQR58_022683 [Nymphon striatum]|nr:hypothetical protein GQR58_022683 [Nymphon striatum]